MDAQDHAGLVPGEGAHGLPPRFATALLAGLLEQAGRALEHDPGAARSLLARASTLLRQEAPGHGTAHAPGYNPGHNPERGGASGLSPWQERRVREHVATHLGGTLRVDDIAAVTRLSGSYFKRAFKVSFGETPHGYLRRMRIERAKRMMLEGREPLAQIALACGLADQAHLSRLFRQITGSSPSAWRRRHASAA